MRWSIECPTFLSDGEMGSAAGVWAGLDDFHLRDLAPNLYDRLSKGRDPDKYRRRLLKLVDPEHRAEKYARFGSHAEFLNDLLAYVHRATRETNSYNVGDEFRCVLVMATVSKIYAQVPREAIAGHIAIGADCAAMNLALSLHRPQEIAQSLLDLARSISELKRNLAEIATGKAVTVIDQIPVNEINIPRLPTRAELLGRALHIYEAMGAKTMAVQTLRDAIAGVPDIRDPPGRADEYACLFSAALALDDRGAQESIRCRINELDPVIDGGDRDHQSRVKGLWRYAENFSVPGICRARKASFVMPTRSSGVTTGANPMRSSSRRSAWSYLPRWSTGAPCQKP